MKLLVFAALVAFAAAVELEQEWEAFKQIHGKKYDGKDADLYRYNIWKSSLALVEEHNKNADKYGYTTAINQFSDLTDKEFAAMYTGYVMAPPSNSTNKVFTATPSFVPEEEVDWRKKGAVTGVKNQGQCGSCWAFSTTGSLEGQHFLKEGALVSLSEQNLVDCSKEEGNNGCKGGLMDRAFQYIIKNGGIDTEESYSYQAHDEVCRFSASNVGATMTSFRDIQRDSVMGLTQAISQVGPISVAMDASGSLFRHYSKGVYSTSGCSSIKLDHGVLAVGYGTYEGTDYFLVKNSWGMSWGMEGYFMIERGSDNMCGLATQASYPIV